MKIELKNVSKYYGSYKALENINIVINEGDIVSIVGPSGSGKTTLLNIIGLLDEPTSGEIIINGVDMTKQDSNRSYIRGMEIGFIFQMFYLLEYLTARENIEMPMFVNKTYKSNRKLREKRSKELLDLVGLNDKGDQIASTLSGGEKQRVAIARALANSPSLLLADEPTGNLDTKSGKSILDLLTRLNREMGITLIIVTHDKQVSSIAHNVITIIDGKTS